MHDDYDKRRKKKERRRKKNKRRKIINIFIIIINTNFNNIWKRSKLWNFLLVNYIDKYLKSKIYKYVRTFDVLILYMHTHWRHNAWTGCLLFLINFILSNPDSVVFIRKLISRNFWKQKFKNLNNSIFFIIDFLVLNKLIVA